MWIAIEIYLDMVLEGFRAISASMLGCKIGARYVANSIYKWITLCGIVNHGRGDEIRTASPLGAVNFTGSALKGALAALQTNLFPWGAWRPLLNGEAICRYMDMVQRSHNMVKAMRACAQGESRGHCLAARGLGGPLVSSSKEVWEPPGLPMVSGEAVNPCMASPFQRWSGAVLRGEFSWTIQHLSRAFCLRRGYAQA